MQATRPNQKIEVFPDGKISIYKVDKSKRKLVQKRGELRFEKQSVSIERYYTSKTDVDTSVVDNLIKVPKVPFVDVNDVVVIHGSGDQYWVLREQLLPERDVLLLELKKAVPKLVLDLPTETPSVTPTEETPTQEVVQN